MKLRDEFDKNAGHGERVPQGCAPWAMLLPDAAEGLLSEAEQAALDRHLIGCAGCARELTDAQRGAAWLALLKVHNPEPPPDLLGSILARTTGGEAPFAQTSLVTGSGEAFVPGTHALQAWPASWPATIPVPAESSLPSFVGQLSRWLGMQGAATPALQPRLAMTSAMAFFSICLTLNLLGFSVRNLHAEALRPAGLQRTVADTGASLVRSFEGIRMVYRVESRVNQWRTATAPPSEAPLQTQ